MGSKNRHAKYILPIILADRKPYQLYIEPFAGGMNTIDKVSGSRWANDIHPYLIDMWNALLNTSWVPPLHISEILYQDIKSNPDNYEPHLVGYVGLIHMAANGLADIVEMLQIKEITGKNIIIIFNCNAHGCMVCN